MKTTLTVDAEYLKILKDLSKEYGAENQQEFFNSMVLYFKETGINPKAKNKSTAEELSKLRNTVISFIREQEKKKLDPLILKLNETFEFLLNYYKNEAVTKTDIKSLLFNRAQLEVPQKQQSISVENQISDEKYQNLVKHVKDIFSDLSKNFKTSTFGGYTIEKAVFERYKGIFEKL